MARVTSKLQVTVPKAIADQFAIKPGDEIDWIAAGDSIRVVKRKSAKRSHSGPSTAARLRHFDMASERQAERDKRAPRPATPTADRGWTREDLYRRGRTG
jgi:AbrB family looped-hinge helix DNA binding protein